MNIEAQGIKKNFIQGERQIAVLKGIDACFEQGKTYAITGVSGTGKSTFLHLLAGLDIPTEGTISFGGKNLAILSSSERSLFLNKSIGLIFQSPYLIKELSVVENVMVPGMIAGGGFETCKKRALELLGSVGILEMAESCPMSLSGGQQQRVAVARAIFNEPSFLLADEPTGNLDIKTGKKIVDLLLKCRQQWAMGIIVSSHDSYVAHSMEQVYQICEGILVES